MFSGQCFAILVMFWNLFEILQKTSKLPNKRQNLKYNIFHVQCDQKYVVSVSLPYYLAVNAIFKANFNLQKYLMLHSVWNNSEGYFIEAQFLSKRMVARSTRPLSWWTKDKPSLWRNKTVPHIWFKIWAKFSFDILGINAENLKVNKCSHKNKSEQMSIWAYDKTTNFCRPKPPTTTPVVFARYTCVY